jgi:eukaryotic-like serine/threonine-protein kinase
MEGEDDDDKDDQDFRPLPVAEGADAIQTLEGRIMGSPQFMAPEQAEGRINDIGERSDIYALGGILYNILTLSPPVDGENAYEILEKIRQGQITPPSSSYNRAASPPALRGAPTDPPTIILLHCPGRRIPEALSAVTMKALALRPEHRYQTVAELQQDLAAYQGGFATSAEQAGTWKLLSLAIKRRKTEFSLAAAGLVVIGVLAAGFMWKVTSTLGELRRTAPTFHRQALALIEEQKFDEALQRISYALTLAPKEPEFYVLKANLLQSLLRLPEARDAYVHALKLQPSHQPAQASRQLTEALLARHQGKSELRSEDLEQMRALMLAQGRSAEALAVAQRMGKQTQDAFAYWQGVLDKAGWKGTVSKDENNRLRFESSPDNAAGDLSPFRGMPLSQLVIGSGTVSNLDPLKGMLLERLQVESGDLIQDLGPLKGMPLASFYVGRGAISDLSPLKGMPLKTLQFQHCTNLADLRPLKGLRLEQLHFYTTYVSDLNPLQGMPLTQFDIINGANINDLSPLRGMPLTLLRLGCPKLADIGVLQGMPLTYVEISASQVSDISSLRGMKLTLLGLGATKVADFSPIKGMPLSYLWVQGTKFSDMSLLQDMPLTSLNLSSTRVTDLSVLHGMRLEELILSEVKVKDLGPLAGMPLASLQASFTLISDISALKGAPLKQLSLGNTAVADISAARGASLTELDLSSTPVRDISAVQGAPLASVYLQNSSVADISGLYGAPLKVLLMHNCRKLQDLSPLAECRQLEYLTLPPLHKDIEFLRSLPNLKRLGYTLPRAGWEQVPTPAEFWKAYDARKR